jgi:VanZ family protein
MVQKQIWLYTKAYFPVIAWAVVIYSLSAQTVLAGFEVSIFDFIFKKLAHMFVYAVLYVLLYRAVTLTTHQKFYYLHLFLPLLIGLIYALSDELHQSLVPGRFATLRDVGFDALGMGIAFLKIYRYI